jgi:hypothetical protein
MKPFAEGGNARGTLRGALEIEPPQHPTPENPLPPAQPSPPPPPSLEPEPVNWPLARSRSVAAAVLLVILISIPGVSRLFALWMLLCGALAVYLYKRRQPAVIVTTGAGVRMGLATGVIAYLILVVLLAGGVGVEQYILHQKPEIVGQIHDQVQQAINGSKDPSAKQYADLLLSPNGLALLFVFTLIIFFFAMLLLCGAGGALGAAMFGKRQT